MPGAGRLAPGGARRAEFSELSSVEVPLAGLAAA